MENYCTSSPPMPRGARSAQRDLLPPLQPRGRRRGLHSGDLPQRQTRKDKQAHGECRTKRVILDIYDAMQQAMETSTPYHTRLDLPPAHGWTPLEITLEVVRGQQSERTKEGTIANPLDGVQQRAAISEIQPKLHFASED